MNWATRRKLLYVGIPLTILFVICFSVFYAFWYQPPTCSDGSKNGDEIGVDCGGSCPRLCSSDALSPVVLWSRIFQVAPGVYNAVAYVENPNIKSSAKNVPYVFTIKDAKSRVITTREGSVFISKNKNFAIFESNIQVTGAIPKVATFAFTAEPNWFKDMTADVDLSVKKKTLTGSDTSPRIDATIENKSVASVERVEVMALVKDGKDNAIGASRTYLDAIAGGQSADVVFTWPQPFEVQSGICKVPADVMLLLDRSGSMASDGDNPPQPLTAVKDAATSFVRELNLGDRVGMLSFATTPSSTIDASLTDNIAKVVSAISAISITASSTQYTNIGDAILGGVQELVAKKTDTNATPVLVLLTDGVPTMPEKRGDKNYPVTYALAAAEQAKKNNIALYAIGLGSAVDANVMNQIASSPDTYFAAGSSANLKSIYHQIATAICVEGPAVIDIITRIIPR